MFAIKFIKITKSVDNKNLILWMLVILIRLQ